MDSSDRDSSIVDIVDAEAVVTVSLKEDLVVLDAEVVDAEVVTVSLVEDLLLTVSLVEDLLLIEDLLLLLIEDLLLLIEEDLLLLRLLGRLSERERDIAFSGARAELRWTLL